MPDKYEIVPTCQIPTDVLQRLYLDVFGYRNYGTFVEIGGYDGITFSNTWGLARAGWHGLYVDANPSSVEACKKNHAGHSVEVESCAVGRGDGECDLFLGGEVSSIIESHARAWGIPADKCVRVPMHTMDFLMRKHNWPRNYDLLVVDVEGAEEDVLRGYSLHCWRPQMVIIETHEGFHGGPYVDAKGCNRTVEFCCGYFRTFRYDKVWSDILNTVYVSRDMVP